MAVLLVSTQHGLGFSHDSVFYWSGAVSLLDGQGVSRPDAFGVAQAITHFPPLYPSVLALGSAVSGVSVEAVARALGAVLLGVNLVLIWHLVRRATDSAVAAGIAGVLALTAPALLERHLWAMSEPLYLTLLMLTIWLLVLTLADSSPIRLVLLAGGCAGLAYLTRYAGASLVFTGALVLLFAGTRPRRDRLRRAAIFSAIGLAPGLAWQVRNALLTGKLSNRVLGWHPPTPEQLKAGGATLASWLPVEAVPAPARVAAVGLLGLLVLLGAAWIWRTQSARDGGSTLLTVSIVHGAIYLGFLLVSLTLFDASTRLDPRILSPFFLVGLLSAAVVAWRAYERSGSRLVGIVLIGLTAVWVLAQARDSLRMLQRSAEQGLGFASADWRQSETAQAAAQLDPELALYSNEALGLYFLISRPASAVPEATDPVKGAARQDYPELLAGMRSRLEAGDAALVLFHPESLGSELPDLATLTEGLQPVFVAEDGAIYLARDRIDE